MMPMSKVAAQFFEYFKDALPQNFEEFDASVSWSCSSKPTDAQEFAQKLFQGKGNDRVQQIVSEIRKKRWAQNSCCSHQINRK